MHYFHCIISKIKLGAQVTKMFRITRISQNGEHRPQFSSHLEEQNVYLVCSEHLVLVRIGGFCLKWWNVATKIHGNIKRA